MKKLRNFTLDSLVGINLNVRDLYRISCGRTQENCKFSGHYSSTHLSAQDRFGSLLSPLEVINYLFFKSILLRIYCLS